MTTINIELKLRASAKKKVNQILNSSPCSDVSVNNRRRGRIMDELCVGIAHHVLSMGNVHVLEILSGPIHILNGFSGGIYEFEIHSLKMTYKDNGWSCKVTLL